LNQRFGYATVLIDSGGLEELLSVLRTDFLINFVKDAVRLLDVFSMVEETQIACAELGGISLGFTLLAVIKEKADQATIGLLLKFIARMLDRREEIDPTPKEHADFLLGFVSLEMVIANQELLLIPAVTCIFPLLANAPELVDLCLSTFMAGLRPAEPRPDYNVFTRPLSMKGLNRFAPFVQAIPANPVGDRVRAAICKTYIVRDAISHLLKRLQMDHGKPRWAPE
jgi:hypothetical protein